MKEQFCVSRHLFYLMADKQFISNNLFCVYHHMSKRSADPGDAFVCAGCNNSFTRLSSHINQSELCRNYYSSTGVEIPLDAGIRPSQRSRSMARRAPSADAGLHPTQSKTMSQGCHEQPPCEQTRVVVEDICKNSNLSRLNQDSDIESRFRTDHHYPGVR